MFGEFTTTTEFLAQIEPILRAKADELFQDDWNWVKQTHGDDACTDLLPRNDQQRWHDAMMIILRQGANIEDPGTAAECAVVADADTLTTDAHKADQERATHNGCGDHDHDHPGSGDDDIDNGDTDARPSRSGKSAVERAESYRCETSFGRPIAPRTALEFAIAGHLRLFLMHTPTKTFEVSDRKRLFKGPLRQGIMLRDRHCQGDGCATHTSRCDADHHIRHTDGGCTNCENGIARCDACHRHKSRLEALGLWNPGVP